jgi:hypothetical protein
VVAAQIWVVGQVLYFVHIFNQIGLAII